MAVADIIAGPVLIYYANYGTSLPADTVAVGGAWPTGWTNIAYTKEPLVANYEFENLEFMIQESLGPVKLRKQSESLKLETTLAEFTGTNVGIAWDGTLSQTAASAGQPAKDEVVMGDDPTLTEKAWGFEGNYVSAAGNSHPIRLFVYKASVEIGGELSFAKEDYTGIPFKLQALEDMTKTAGQRLFKLQKITAPAT